MRVPIFQLLALLGVRAYGDGIRPRIGAKCLSRDTDWVITMPQIKKSITHFKDIAEAFTQRVAESSGDRAQHYVSVVGYSNADNKCVSFHTRRMRIRESTIYHSDFFAPSSVTIDDDVDTWPLAIFDSWVRPIKIRGSQQLGDTTKKMFVTFYHGPSTESPNANLTAADIDNDPYRYCTAKNYANVENVQEIVQQADATILAVRSVLDSEDANKKWSATEDAQFESLRQSGLRLGQIQLRINPNEENIDDLVDRMVEVLNELECDEPVKTITDRVQVIEAVGGCSEPIDFVLVHPSTQYGIAWAQAIANGLQDMANVLNTFDLWELAVVAYNDKPKTGLGSNSYGYCARIVMDSTQLRRVTAPSYKNVLTYDKGDEKNAGIDAVARSIIAAPLMDHRTGAKRVYIYVHDKPAHDEGDASADKIDAAFMKEIEKDINAGCEKRDYISIDTLMGLLGDEHTLIEFAVPPLSKQSDANHFRLFKAKGVQYGRVDVGQYAGQSTFGTLVRALQPFCYPR